MFLVLNPKKKTCDTVCSTVEETTKRRAIEVEKAL
jgi:hypothetical protein